MLLAVTQPDFQLTYLIQAAAFAIAILGLNLVTGFSGQISLGHSAFFGIGGYATAVLVTDHGWPFLATFPVAALLGLVFGFLVGLPALRISGLYLALVTLAVAAVFPVVVKLDALAGITGGPNGKSVEFRWTKPAWMGLDVSAKGWRFLTQSAERRRSHSAKEPPGRRGRDRPRPAARDPPQRCRRRQPTGVRSSSGAGRFPTAWAVTG